MVHQDKETVLAEEVLIIETSGEIPEVAYHNALYYLTADEDGPGLLLEPQDLLPLKLAVIERYRQIMLRDLSPENRDKRIYRGLARCWVNWERLTRFCREEELDLLGARAVIAKALHSFLIREVHDVASGLRRPCINCSAADLCRFVAVLGIDPEILPAGWRDLCL